MSLAALLLAAGLLLCAPASSSDSQLLVTWYAPFLSGGGYSSEAFAFANAFLGLSNMSSLSFAIQQHGDSINAEFIAGLSKGDRAVLKAMGAGSGLGGRRVDVCHSEPGAWSAPTPNYRTNDCPRSKQSYSIGRTMFETDSIPSGWSDRLNFMQEVWVPTEFHREIFAARGVQASKLFVVAEPVDTDFYRPVGTPGWDSAEAAADGSSELDEHLGALLDLKRQGHFLFLFVGKWERRKGLDVLLEAFASEFAAGERVALVLLTSSYHSSASFDAEIEKVLGTRAAEDPPYLLLPPNLPQRMMPQLYSSADVFVSATRGEGWGRPQVEAMSCGTPVLSTNWSGPTEYLTGANGYPLDYELVDSDVWPGHRWAQPNSTHLRQLMREAFEAPAEARGKGAQARADMVKKYSIAEMQRVVRGHMERISSL